jgi:hypothetical protein
MSWSSKILVMLVLTGLASAAVMPQMMISSPAAHSHPAGCHENGQKSSPATPVSYQCCQAGHRFAVLQTSSDLAMPLAAVARSQQLLSVPVASGRTESPLAFMSSGSPPLSTSLRI